MQDSTSLRNRTSLFSSFCCATYKPRDIQFRIVSIRHYARFVNYIILFLQKFTKNTHSSRELVVIHETKRLALCAKKDHRFFGAEDDILRKRKASSLDHLRGFDCLRFTRSSRELVVIHETERLALCAKKDHRFFGGLFWRRRRDSNSCYGFPILLP